MLYLRSSQRQSICAHAESTYPDECCGLLLGDIQTMNRWVRQVYPVANAWGMEAEQTLASLGLADADRSKGDRYWIDPGELLIGQQYARDRQWQVIGIYHSHPDHPAVPSECDRVLAWSEYSYLIVSVNQGQAQDLLSWRLNENHQFTAQAVQTLPTISIS